METLPLHPSIFNLIIYVICPAVAILQWIIIAPLAREKKVWDSLEGAVVAKGVKHKLPFLKDGFFILWNIFPLFLLGIYIYMGVNWFNWQGDLLLLNDSLLPDIYYRIYAFRFNTFVVSAIVLFSLYSALWQKTKQGKFIANVKNNVD
ncbi:MAG: hypothetical protein KKE61_22565, partial [Proteobacteria bacterium]|nr:hypothetical protein [Pseudomonadota bacterium]